METLDLAESVKSRIFERRIKRRFLLEERGAPLPEKPQPEVVKRTLDDLRSHGYETHAKALAVSPIVSWQGNHVRRESLALSGAPSRLATREAHDAGVRGCSATVAMIERERLADHVTVVSRSGDVLYSNEQRAGQWMKHAQGVEVLQVYRDKPLSKAEAKQHDANWGTVLELAGRRHVRDGVSPTNAAREIDAIRTDRTNDAIAMRLDQSEKKTDTKRAGSK